MSVYALDKLMSETRRIAAEYHRTTGKALPVSIELAKHDACHLLNLDTIEPAEAGVDAVGLEGPLKDQKLQIKGRVIFDPKKKGQRIGQLNLDAAWDAALLVLMDADYEPFEIYLNTKDTLLKEAQQKKDSGRLQRGSLSVARFKGLGQLLWTRHEGTVSVAIGA